MAKAPIKVVALKRGQLPDRTWVDPGAKFEVDPDLFSDRWMQKVAAKKPAKKAE